MNRTLVALEILHVLYRYRRGVEGNDCGSSLCTTCLSLHVPKLEDFLARNEPVHFVLPAFPAKSPNHTKVLSHLPDMAERTALAFLQNLCGMIEAVYEPGARLTICSDGRVFSDAVAVSDEHVTAYSNGLRSMLEELRTDRIEVFNLDDVFSGCAFEQMRGRLLDRYAESVPALRERILREPAELNVFNGIARFLFEDFVVLQADRSRSAVRKDCKDLAYRVLQRSRAWGDLVAERFPRSVRLSIHPQPCGCGKIGIHLVETADNWLTPWHGSAVDVGGRFMLMKRSEAEAAGAWLVERRGRPSHFVMPVVLESETKLCSLRKQAV